MTDFLYTDARWTEHFVEVNDPHKEGHHVRFYFEPSQRTWVGLTDEEIQAEWLLTPQHDKAEGLWFGRRLEAKLKEKNNG